MDHVHSSHDLALGILDVDVLRMTLMWNFFQTTSGTSNGDLPVGDVLDVVTKNIVDFITETFLFVHSCVVKKRNTELRSVRRTLGHLTRAQVVK